VNLRLQVQKCGRRNILSHPPNAFIKLGVTGAIDIYTQADIATAEKQDIRNKNAALPNTMASHGSDTEED